MTLYNVHRPRDRSHYERFRHYHETFYRSVEVASVTPFATLAGRLDSNPLLEVTLLLNIDRQRGDTTIADSLVRRFADHFWGEAWPGKTHPRVYYDPRSVADDGPGGVLHAKAVVADDEAVFITSANLTEAAFDRNIELGLLVRDRTLAATTVLHFRTLIEQDRLRLLPSPQ